MTIKFRCNKNHLLNASPPSIREMISSSRMRPNRRQVVTFLLSFAFGLLFSNHMRNPSRSQKDVKYFKNDVFINCDNFAASDQTYRVEDPEARGEKSRELENFYETIDDGRNFVEAVKAAEEEVLRIPNQCKFGSENKSVKAEVSAREENFLYVGVMTAGKYINKRFVII